MTTVTIHQAKTQLSRLLAAVEAGEEVTIARRDKPVAKLVPIAPKPNRVPGLLKGKIHIGPEFFEPLPEEELALWEGRDDKF
jgi:prevent-host-death family protein